ncbi:hypothetical protein OG883_13405 [Streptomyces sp. NBC_01142]|uniref:hypothetical protein n=1 Tax=Streptomyces sp. NBC_01142 TaxID=2975865 RepID=UPI00225823B0|nr:hypothetical protein [Streptomyces sp. NBC_01142]MCX4820886.1 hypothetical protein [Streptomyces sp. NBC_01142]
MTRVSRRALLGYSGTAAAGAVLASSGSAQAAGVETTGASKASAVEFGPGTQFEGSTSIGDIDAYMEVKFSVRVENAPPKNNITALEIANALNEVAASRGWPPIQFNGTISAPLN